MRQTNRIILLLTLSFFCFFSSPRLFAINTDFREIAFFAKLSSLSYTNKKTIQDFAKSNNHKLIHHKNLPEINLAYYILGNPEDKSQIIVIRGTNNSENALIDSYIKLVPDKLAGIKVHEGFSYAARLLYQDAQPYISRTSDIYTTGHSLGGAVASLVAIYLTNENFHFRESITFGQPKVTNLAGANQYENIRLLRAVTPKDIVPVVPPLDITDINNLDIYWHLGTELVLYDDETYSLLEGTESMLRFTKFTQQALTDENIEEHNISHYMALIKNKLNHSREVKYENDLNLFNLFN